MRIISILSLTWILLFAGLAHGQNTQSLLELNVTDREDYDEDPVRLQSLVIEGTKAASVANFTVTAIIGNADEFDEIEAEFVLPLPTGAIVNDYALDIEGQLIDGVLTERERARKEYTDKVVDGIDPGFAETLNDNRYRTYIYPIEEESHRTVRMGFSVPLGQGTDWTLNSSLPAAHLKVSAPDFGIRSETKNTSIDLSFPLGEPDKSLRSTRVRHPVAGDFALIALTQEEINRLALNARPKTDRIAIIWDGSLSRSDDRIGEEYALITKVLRELNPTQSELIIGNDRISKRTSYDGANGAALLTAELSQSVMDGGTRLPALFPADLSADLCFLFSDGNSLHTGTFPTPQCPVIAISSADDVKPGVLAALAERTGGQYMTLDQVQNNGLPQSLNPALSSKDLINARWLGPPQDGLIMGRLKDGAGKTVELTISSVSGNVNIKNRLRDKVTHKGLPTYWAQTQAEFLRAEGLSVPDLIEFSRPFSLAGPESALIVLEEPEDYVYGEIPPPATYPKELMAQYKEELADYEEDKVDDLESRLEDVGDIAEELFEWYAEVYDDYDMSEWPLDQLGRSQAEPAPLADSENDEIVVTGSRLKATTSVILPREWSPDRPYLKAMNRASPSNLMTVYEEQKQTYGDLPAFYLESADLFHRKGLSDKASQIVQGALELPSANTQTYSQVAHRLLSYGDYDRAVEIYEYVKALSPNLLYVYYNLAVGLHDRALAREGDQAQSDLKRALTNLEHILRSVTDWDYEGVDIVALAEANTIYQRLSRAERRASTFAQLLHKPVQADLRVVVDWNTDYTDLDLWVEEPSGESAYYGNSETTIGGFLSNDMTDGYGPEQYLLNYAVPGTYKIRVKYFSDSEYDPNGPVTVRARITQYFGSPDQVTKTIIMELSEDKEEQLVGEFVVAE